MPDQPITFIDASSVIREVSASYPLPTSANGFLSSVDITRSNDTTGYTAGDAWGAAVAALTFPNIGPVLGGPVLLTLSRFRMDIAAVLSGMSSWRLYLYSVTPPSAPADNAIWDLPAGDRASFRGYLDLGTLVDLGSTLYVEAPQSKQIHVPVGGSLFGLLVTNGAYTPAAQSVANITLYSIGLGQ